MKIGEELLTVYRSQRKADKSDTYDEIRQMLVAHVKPNTVVFTEYDDFSTSVKTRRGNGKRIRPICLRQLAKSCLILQQFVANIGRHDVERKCVVAENITLEKAIEIATTLENPR